MAIAELLGHSLGLLDAVPGTEESLKVWEGVLATIGWAAGNWGAVVDGKLVNKGRVVPDQLPRAKRLAALRTRTLMHREFGDTETARSVLTRLAGLLEVLDVDEEPEPERTAPPPPPRRRTRKKPG